LIASLAFFGPLNNNVFAPVGALNASSSKVRHSPPAAVILALAVAVNFIAAMLIFGTLRKRLSSVTVAITTTVLLAFASDAAVAAMRDMDIGGRLILDMKRRRRTTLLKAASVRPVNGSALDDVICFVS